MLEHVTIKLIQINQITFLHCMLSNNFALSCRIQFVKQTSACLYTDQHGFTN